MIIRTFLIVLLSAVLKVAAQPTTITWQGKLLDNSGNAINQNNVAMTFAIFDASSGGNQLWPASGVVTKTVNIVQGLYSVQLGTGIGDDIAFSAAMFNGETPWLEVKIGTETLPRSEITNVPFALISNELSTGGWENPGEIGKTTPNTGKFTSLESGTIKLTNGAGSGKVLSSDTAGLATWTTLPAPPVTSVNGMTGEVTLTKSDIGLGNVENTALSAWAGSANITTLGTIGSGTWNAATIGISHGGTGATTKTAAFDSLSPMTTIGDLIFGGTSGTGTRLAKGTAGQVLTMNAGATAPVWSTPYSGLTNFTESNYTYNGKTGVKFLATNAASAVDVVLQPKGNGGILAQQPDGTVTGGNNRGMYAADFQTIRALATQVASGPYSFIGGGSDNTASGYCAVVAGGGYIGSFLNMDYGNKASGDFSAVGGGTQNVASGDFSTIPGGMMNNATARRAAAFGSINEVSGENAIAVGNQNQVSGEEAIAVGTNNKPTGTNSIAVGIGNTAQSYAEIVLGTFATVGSGTPSDFIDTDRLLVVGNGTYLVPKNALTILKNANTTIGGTLTLNGNGTSTSITFPANRGTSGQFLKTAGDGTTSWSTPTDGTVTSVTGTSPISVATGTSTPVISIAAATTSSAGSMSAADKTKLDAQTTGTAAGQMQYWNGTAWVTIDPGTAGQLLSINSSGLPQWQSQLSILTSSTLAPTMSSSGVTFNGVFNPNNLYSSVKFEYGTTSDYGNTTETTVYIPVSTNINTSSLLITGLTLGTTYHVRLVTQTVLGTFYSNDIAFTYLYNGALYQGGLVFNLDGTGLHGKVCAISDQSTSANWSDAFNICANYTVGVTPGIVYHDWCLPTASDLFQMYTSLKSNGLGSFSNSFYWSSEATTDLNAISLSFINGNQSIDDKNFTNYVRAIRTF